MISNMEIIIYIIKTLLSNIFVTYSYKKMLNINKYSIQQKLLLFTANVIITLISTYTEFYINSFISGIVLYLSYGIVIGLITKKKIGHSIIITVLGYVICGAFLLISVISMYFLEDIIKNYYLNLIIISTVQFALIFTFFKIKRFKNGFAFLNDKLDNEIASIITINIGTIVILIYCLIGTYYNHMKWSLIIVFFILCIITFISIKKMLAMHYKQILLTNTMEEYKKEISDKQKEIDTLKSEKKNISKITHEFYNRQKALELLVASNMNKDNIDRTDVSPNVLNIIESLTNEYSGRFEKVKQLPKLDTTEIEELDNMFKYMQSECSSRNIDFKLKIMGNIHSLANNIIPKNKLETLIGDHLRDAINAVDICDTENKEILAILGINNKKYEFSVYDTGVEFEIDTLMKLGLEAVTTNAERGGTGTGFMTTFETLAETKASLVITEYPNTDNIHYTKCVSIIFDNNNQYKICSYRANEIRSTCKDNRIKVEDYIIKK